MKASKAAKLTGYTRRHINHLCSEGVLEAKKIDWQGKKIWEISKKSIEDYMGKKLIKKKYDKNKAKKGKMTMKDHKCYGCPFSTRISKTKLYLPFSHCIWER
jgi:hypothetical protein